MEAFKIKGNRKLSGTIKAQGAKNEALQVICAVVLTEDKTTIRNIPEIIDIHNLFKILRTLGVKITKLSNNTYEFDPRFLEIDKIYGSNYIELSKKIRGSVMLLGSLLAKFGKSQIPVPGGDKIGRRSLDVHLLGLEQLGAEIKVEFKNNTKFYAVKGKKLNGCNIWLNEASVTGTANLILASVLAEGQTTIYNAACEPYLQQLCKMLVKMGAVINGIGSNHLTISGVSRLKGVEHTVMSDMIEIGSWIGLAAITKSNIKIEEVNPYSVKKIIEAYNKLGIYIKEGDNSIEIPSHEDGYEINNKYSEGVLTIYDAPWPGLSPDILSMLLVTATQARGSVLIHQKMFESRLYFTDSLVDMGAQIVLCDPHRAMIIGNDFKENLKGRTLNSPDIRAGMAILAAALSAEGTSIIKNIEQIDRGYEFIDTKLKAIGASIERIEL